MEVIDISYFKTWSLVLDYFFFLWDLVLSFLEEDVVFVNNALNKLLLGTWNQCGCLPRKNFIAEEKSATFKTENMKRT